MKKQYYIPTTRVVILDTEDTILAVSGEQADQSGMFSIYSQTENDQQDFSGNDWSSPVLSASPW